MGALVNGPTGEIDSAPPASSLVGSLGWAIFLGMSWTWCIGMFLPVLLMRELGPLGWVIFAIPNVMGAAAMGWALRSRRASLHLVEKHRPALIAFSLVTVAFHLFFAEWFIGHRLLRPELGVGVWFAAWLFYFIGGRAGRWDRLASTAVLLVSLGCAAVAIYSLRTDLVFDYPMTQPLPAINAAALAPICIFGFVLCPYLDLTFHRARQNTSAIGARFAFTAGFGLFFFAMLAFTFSYVWPLVRLLAPTPYPIARALRYAVGIHMIVQSGLTIALHLRAVPSPRRPWHFGLAAIVLAAPVLAGNIASHMDYWNNVNPGEIGYRLFMGFYGLVFPAYVWIVVLPRKRAVSIPKGVIATGAAVLISAPFFYVGFIQERMLYLLPGLALVLLMRWIPIAASDNPVPAAAQNGSGSVK